MKVKFLLVIVLAVLPGRFALAIGDAPEPKRLDFELNYTNQNRDGNCDSCTETYNSQDLGAECCDDAYALSIGSVPYPNGITCGELESLYYWNCYGCECMGDGEDNYNSMFDCDGELGGNLEEDCTGVCDGPSVEDNCGVCVGGNLDDLGCGCFEPGPSGCDNACGSTKVIDECGVCDGDGFLGDCLNIGCDNMDCAGACGGDAEMSFLYPDNDGDELGDCNNPIMELCDQLPPTSEGLVLVSNCPEDGDIDDNCESNFHDCMGVCDGSDENTTYYEDSDGDGLGSDISDLYCSGEVPAGWVLNSQDIDDNCESNYHDCLGVCDGTNVQQACGCGAPGTLVIPPGDCDCNTNVLDCVGICGGGIEFDDCGECGGPDFFIDSAGNPCTLGDSDCTLLNGNCDCAGNVLDCEGTCGGGIEYDECGECGGVGILQSCGCGPAGTLGIPPGDCDCNTNVLDCWGVCGSGIEFDACDICDGPGAFYCGGGVYECSEADCPDSINYCLDLQSGANLISLYALPEDVSVQSVMSPLGENISGVITEGGACSQIAPGNWVGSQCSLSPEKGYWVILNSNIDLCLNDAYFTDPAILYGLHSGANLISFPSEFSVSVSDAFPDDIEVAITGVITEGGACSQLSPGNWVGSQCSFNGGMGYWVISMKSVAFTYDLSTLSRIKSNNSFGLTFPNGFEVRQSSHQAFYFIEDINLGNEANEGWILAYHGNTLVGARQWAGKIIDIPVMGYDGNAYSKKYMETGDIPNFKYLNHYSGKLTNLHNTDTPQWENNGMYLLGALEARNVVPQKIMLNAYPNPFNPITTLSFTVLDEGILQLSIYNISGQMITTLARELKEPGIYEYSWDANAYPSGVYFAHLNLGPQSYTQKLVLMK